MNDWKPQPIQSQDIRGLNLSAEEGYVLSRLDGTTSVQNLSLLTALPPERLEGILTRLLAEGALKSEGAPPSLKGETGEAGFDEAARTAKATPEVRPLEARPLEPEPLEPEPLEPEPLEPEPLEAQAPETARTPVRSHRPERPDDEEEALETKAQEEPHADDDTVSAADDADPEDAQAQLIRAGNYRKLFETELHPLERDERIARAKEAEGAHLCAFCFDPDPAVIRAVFENALTGLEQARLVANHHHNAAGLDALANDRAFLLDPQVQRLLLRNPQLPDRIFQRLVSHRPLIELHRMSFNRDLPERTRRGATVLMRNRFSSSSAEERVDFLFSTEGRVLPALVGLHFDGRTIALMCTRTHYPTLLIHNLARFPGTPPAVLKHLANMPVVKRQPQLRAMLIQHPNAPGELKHQRHG